MLNVCLIGAGRIGIVHATAINNNADVNLYAIVDYLPAAAKQLAVEFNSQTLDLEQAFSDNNIDAFIIASSTNTHAEMIKRCAAIGKPVFCEKPIDLNIDKAQECVDIVKKSGIVCMIGFNRRFDPDIAQLKQQIDNKVIGSVQTLTINSRDPEPPSIEYLASSGGLFYDMMIHDFDMACWLLQEKPTTVYASASAINEDIARCGDIDIASVILSTKSGAIATILNGRQAAFGYDQRIEVFGSTGMLQLPNILENNVILSNSRGTNTARAKNFFLQRYEQAFANELAHFIEALTANKQPSVSIKDGFLAMQIAEAAIASLSSGNVVKL